MPTLDFKGKPFVYSHHLSVPFRELKIDAARSLPGKAGLSLDDNLIIHGDNLHALKALLPKYAGKVDVIYIDPPYNTGNEGWAYNDNVNSPLMKEWLGTVVDGEDLERHDKWLCMMWPRLTLLNELLSDDGIIAVSLDDNESHSLKKILDEIFGEQAYLANVIVESNKRGQTYGAIAKTHEFLFLYGKGNGGLSELDERGDAPYTDERGGYELWELRNRNPKFGKHNRPNLFFPIYLSKNPFESDHHYISLEKSDAFPHLALPSNNAGEDGCWRWSKEKIQNSILNGQAPDLIGRKNRNDKLVIMQRARKKTVKAKTIWRGSEFLNETGTVQLGKLGLANDFQFPKPISLIQRVLKISSDKDAIVLDSFAGSGTTAHAVQALNAEDGGNRKFILVETEDYADTITAERVRRVIKGVPKAKDKTLESGLGGSFTFCDLGDPIDMESFFGESGSMPAYDQLASYIAYTAIGEALGKAPKKAAKDWFIGEVGGVRLHLIYKPDGDFMKSHQAALDMDTVKTIAASNKTGKPSYVFAAAKYMGQSELTRDYDMTFCQLPYAIHRIMGDGVDG